MIIYHDKDTNAMIAELKDSSFVIRETQDALDLMTMTDPPWCSRFIIYEENLSPDFFKLASGLAGNVLQKFSNYRIRLAVVGDFSKYKSKNLNDFFRESNKIGHILFLSSVEEALEKLKV
jgi:hypothetical protein